MLHVEELTKHFGSVAALNRVSFSIAEGEVVGLLGENGAGKTTTLQLLSGALYPDEGRVTVAGRDLYGDFVGARRKVGYLPERLPLDPAMRVGRFLDYVAQLRGLPRRERDPAVAAVVDSCDLGDFVERRIGVLSRGMRMRVGMAQALVHNPELLLLDEPTAGLDPHQVINMRQLIFRLAGNRTVLFSSHNLVEVSECCNRVLFLKDGDLIAEDNLASLGGRDGEFCTVLMRFANPPPDLPKELGAVDGVRAVEPAPSDGARSVLVTVRSDQGYRERMLERVVFLGWGLLEVRDTTESLASVFLRRTDRMRADHAATDIPKAAGGAS